MGEDIPFYFIIRKIREERDFKKNKEVNEGEFKLHKKPTHTRIIWEGDSGSQAQEIKKHLNHRMIRRGKCELPTANNLLNYLNF